MCPDAGGYKRYTNLETPHNDIMCGSTYPNGLLTQEDTIALCSAVRHCEAVTLWGGTGGGFCLKVFTVQQRIRAKGAASAAGRAQATCTFTAGA